ncbi:hypothetical protein ZIOFF_026524 [Zingiber officinale]|uniref:Pectinesterase n=1 Tax=Zingiber officinale TaxID=94328 RepID=A0A8J5LEU0_ZINOF|nr:hypothetical protein ZIOFF_026524 [Zingiber officinale]
MFVLACSFSLFISSACSFSLHAHRTLLPRLATPRHRWPPARLPATLLAAGHPLGRASILAAIRRDQSRVGHARDDHDGFRTRPRRNLNFFNGMGSSSSSCLLPSVFDRHSTQRGGADKAYRENVIVPDNKKNLILIGVGTDRTVVTSNRNFLDGLETYDTATFVHHLRHDLREHGRAVKKQVMAMRNNADLSIFYHCKLLGYQDTLYMHSNHQFYCDYEVYGTVDFIFGDASPCSRIATSTHVYCSRGTESGDGTGSHSLQWEHWLLHP